MELPFSAEWTAGGASCCGGGRVTPVSQVPYTPCVCCFSYCVCGRWHQSTMASSSFKTTTREIVTLVYHWWECEMVGAMKNSMEFLPQNLK